MRQILLQNATDILLQKCDKSLLQNAPAILLQKVTVLLQNATILLQNTTIVTKYNVYYKMRRYSAG